MKNYNFDAIINRDNTDCVKYDLRSLIFGTNDLIPMWVADMDFETPDFILNAIQQRLKHPILAYSFRPEEYSTSIINWLFKNFNWEVKSNEISFCPGVVSGLVIAIEALTNPGDGIIIQTPVYFPFFTSINGTNRKLIENPLKCDGSKYEMDFEDLESKIDASTKLLILCNPHNPIGRAWTKIELSKLAEICKKHDILVISDEIHSDLVFTPSVHIPFSSISEDASLRTITFMAPSKTFNLAGLSSSFVVIKNQNILNKYNKNLEIHHLQLGNIFGTIATTAAYTYGQDWLVQLKMYLKDNIDFATGFFKSELPSLKLVPPEATYMLWIDMRALNLSEVELEKFCTNATKIGFSFGKMFGKEGIGFMRMNIACSRAVLVKALNQLKRSYDTLLQIPVI